MQAKLSRFFLLAAGFVFVALATPTVFAGSPLLCHPFDIGGAKSLPFGTGGWRTPLSSYDINRLSDDTLALLQPDTPVIVRMETLRRATIYAMKDQRIAAALHARLAARVEQTKQDGLALFDLGYLEETYKQAAVIENMGKGSKSFDGYSTVVRAITLRGGDGQMEFAAALIAAHPRRSTMNEHLQRALAKATETSLLGRNLVRHFGDMGGSLSELRARVGLAKN